MVCSDQEFCKRFWKYHWCLCVPVSLVFHLRGFDNGFLDISGGVVVVELPQMPEMTLRIARAVRGRRAS